MTDDGGEDRRGIFQNGGVETVGTSGSSGTRRALRPEGLKNGVGRGSRVFIHCHVAVVGSAAAAALRQIRLGVGEGRCNDRRETDRQQQRNRRRAAHGFMLQCERTSCKGFVGAGGGGRTLIPNEGCGILSLACSCECSCVRCVATVTVIKMADFVSQESRFYHRRTMESHRSSCRNRKQARDARYSPDAARIGSWPNGGIGRRNGLKIRRRSLDVSVRPRLRPPSFHRDFE